MKPIPYTTVNDQIKKLKGKGLKFLNEDFASKMINNYGYFNIINSYKEPYVHLNNDIKEYNDGVTFEQIFSLFTFDHTLRNGALNSILEVEEIIKAAAAEVLSKNFGTDPADYLKFSNFSDRRCDPKFRLATMLNNFQHIISTSTKNPIAYYRDVVGSVPPWILFKGIYLTDIVNFIRLFKRKEKIEFVNLLFDIKNPPSDYTYLIEFSTDILSMCIDLRNLAAHGGRFYNYSPGASIRLDNSRCLYLENVFDDFDFIKNNSGVTLLFACLTTYNNTEPFAIFSRAIENGLNNHLNHFPQDRTLITTYTGAYITDVPHVWVNKSGKCFHNNKACCNMSHPVSIPREFAEQQGLSKCSRCFK